MADMVEVQTADLIGPALDWCVCVVATGAQYHDDYGRATLIMPGAAAMMDGLKRPGYASVVPDYSSDWALGGPLRDKYDVGIEPGVPDGLRYAYVPGRGLNGSFGETALIALCRAIVASHVGDVVQVPATLVAR